MGDGPKLEIRLASHPGVEKVRFPWTFDVEVGGIGGMSRIEIRSSWGVAG